MNYPLYNSSNLDLAPVQHLFDSFLPFAEKYLGIPKCPEIHLVSDQENSQLPLGKTAFYDPNVQKITVFTDNRHIKDILRSLSHELVHHKQNLQGMFDGGGFTGPGYAQKDQHLRDMEREAYEKGNLCLRDWEDKHKKQLQESIYNIKGDNSKMSYKNWRNQEVNDRLMESWGFKAPKSKVLTESVEAHEQELDEAHCGGVHEDEEEIMEEGHGMCPTCGMSPCACPVMEEEAAKPDFLDLDKDGDKEESMKSAVDNAKEKKVDEAVVRKTIREAIAKALKNREA